MGVLNVTPDSFSDGGLYLHPRKAFDRALQMEAEGADLIDVGGESSRPGALSIPSEEEGGRVLRVIEQLAKRLQIPISIDTTKSIIAQRALDVGASIINDVSGFTLDSEMFRIASEAKAGIVIMHSKGTPQTMQRFPRYRNLIVDIHRFLKNKIEEAIEHRIPRSRIVIDPGIGFGKTINHNLKIINQLSQFLDLGVPILVGPSRKAFIGKILGLSPAERIEGTTAAVAIAVFNGARILRVHDVGALAKGIRVAEAIRRGEITDS